MFAEFVLPEVRYEGERFDGRVIFHLDGPGELPHVDHLIDCDVFAIQWVCGAGNPGGTDPCWDDLYRRLIDADKRICIGAGDPAALAALFERFPGRYFHISAACSRERAAEILAVRDRYVG
jgi:5-methyltetrahydrofolate--homocysteine methyltransferase